MKLSEIAAQEIGVRETSTNSSPRIIQYQRTTWLKPAAWPWCAAFVSWCLVKWLEQPEIRQKVESKYGRIKDIGNWRCRDASAYGWEKWAKDRGIKLLDDTAKMQSGDIVTFDMSHIGIVEREDGDHIYTIEGNTNEAGGRDGIGVFRKRRAKSFVRRVIRILD